MGKNKNSKAGQALKTNPCEKYELAITNYVLGEKIDIPQKELFDHLAQCPSCQGDLRNWRATYATMRAREYAGRPEVQQRTQAFIHKLVTSPAQGEPLPPVIDTERIVGLATGEIYNCLKKSGPLSLSLIRKNTGLEGYPFYEAMGWLNQEKKIIVRGKNDQPEYAELQP